MKTHTFSKSLSMKLANIAAVSAVTAGFLAAPQIASAKKPGVLEGKPITVDRLEYRKFRFQLTPMVGMSLSQPFVHVGTAGLKMRFDFLDWLGVRAGFQYGVVPINAKLLRGILDGALPEGTDATGMGPGPIRPTSEFDNPAPLLHDFQRGLTRLQWMASVDVAFTPFAGKLGLFSSVFTEYDVYIFGGLGLTGWQRHFPDARSTSEQLGIANSDDPDGVDFCKENPMAAQNEECLLHPVKSGEGVKIGGSVGGGIHLFLTDWVSINPEIHDIIVSHNPAGLNATISDVPPQVTNDDNVITHNLMFNLGVTFYLPPKAKRSRISNTSETDAVITGPGPDSEDEPKTEVGGVVGGEVGAPPAEEAAPAEDEVVEDDGELELGDE